MRKLAFLLAAGPLLLAGTVAPGSPAQARACEAPGLNYEDVVIAPDPLAVGTTVTQTLSISAAVYDPCSRADKVTATVVSPSNRRTFTLTKADHDAESGYTVFGLQLDLAPADLVTADARTWRTEFKVRDGVAKKTQTVTGPNFLVVRRARADVVVAPEKTLKDQPVAITGLLERTRWESRKYNGFPGRRVDLEVRTPDGAWAYLKSVRSDARGQLRTSVKAEKSLCYRWTYPGSLTTSPATSAADCLTVA